MNEFDQLKHELRALAFDLRELRAVIAVQTPQYFTVDDLARRYRLGRDRICKLARQHGIASVRGHALRFSQGQVAELDTIIKRATANIIEEGNHGTKKEG